MNPFNTQKLLNYAYELAKSEFNKETFSFNSLWSKLWKQTKELKKETVKDWIGLFYLELLQDPRFLNCGTNTWILREFLTFDEIKKIKNTVFNIPAEEILEEDLGDLKADEGKVEESDERSEEDNINALTEDYVEDNKGETDF